MPNPGSEQPIANLSQKFALLNHSSALPRAQRLTHFDDNR
jgi:hypothetical protein